MTITLSSTYASPYVLSGPADNPATITATGLLEAGLGAGSLSSAWTITNSGKVFGSGIGLGDGNVTNQAKGTISGSITGIFILDAGTVVNHGTIAGTGTSGFGVYMIVGSVTNAATALITGSAYGVATGFFAAGTGTVVNDGSIAGGGVGVGLRSGGAVTNTASASITGGGHGVYIERGVGTVVNDGSISSTATNATGVGLQLGGSVTNMASAWITGDNGVMVGGIGTVVNDGKIAGTGTNGTGIELTAGGSVTNATAAKITGGHDGISVFGGAGAVFNHGSVAGITGNGVDLNIGGVVTNTASASITGGGHGVYIRSRVGTVVNDGNIAGTGTNARGVELAAGGSVTNATAGMITGGYDGISVLGGAGTVFNRGSVAGITGNGVYLNTGGSVTNATSGTITGGISRSGVGIGGFAGRVVNYGSIANTNTGGIGIDLAIGGSATNASSASIVAVGLGIFAHGGAGTVVNRGKIAITGSTGDGVFLSSGGTVTNAIFGSVDGGAAGVYIGGGAGIVVNDGTIANDSRHGVFLDAGGSVTNATSASITSSYHSVEIAGGTGTVVNDGLIVATGTASRGVKLQVGGSVTNAASATITSAGRSAVFIYGGSGTVGNNGYIASTGTGPNSDGIKLLSGSVINAATASITGDHSGVYIYGGAGTVVNAGSIVGSGGTAVALAAGFVDRVVIDPGAAFIGKVDGGNTIGSSIVSTLELAGTGGGTLDELGTTFINFGTVIVDVGATWTVKALSSALAGVALIGNGTASTLMLTSAGSPDLSGVTKFPTIDLAATGITLTVTDALLSSGALTINDEASGNTVSAASDTAASKAKTLTYKAGSGTDSFTGGFENDKLNVSAAAVGSNTLTGGSGTNTLTLTTAGSAKLGGVSKFATISLAAGNTAVTVTDATLSGGTVTINDGASGNNTISAAGDTAASTGKTFIYATGKGKDSFTGGFENDVVRVSATAVGGDLLTGGSGTNTLTLTTAGTFSFGGISKFATINLAAGNNTVSFTNKTLANGSITLKDGAGGNNSVSAAGDTAASNTKTLNYTTGSGTDSFTGGFENDVVRVSAAAVGGDTLTGGSGTNMLTLTSAGSANLGGISKFATINLAAGNSTVTVTDKTLFGGTITITDGASGNNAITAAGDTSASTGKTLIFNAGTGVDHFAGGFENNVLRVSAKAVGGDTLTGGSGINTLVLTSAGTFSLGGVSNFATINLAAGTNTVTVTDKTLTASITLKAGASGNNTISAAGDTAASKTKTLTYSTGSGTDSFTGGFENDTIVTTSAALNAGDSINGGSGANTMMLSGGGVFNLGALKVLAKIQTVDAAEGQAAGGGVPSGVQIVDLRAGLDQTVNVASGTPNPLDPNPEVITINGAANKDVINLGAGTDTVVIGGAGEMVNSGGGTALLSATAAFAGALVNGGGGTTSLKITTGGTATLNASDSRLTVDLTFATNLTLSKMSFVNAVGSTGNDTITALAQGQTLTGGGGKDTLNGFSGFGDVFSDTSAHLNTTTIGNFGGSDLIDLTDMNPNSIQPLTYNTTTQTLTATDGTHTANIKFIGSYTLNDFQIGGSDGHTGSLIKFV